MFSPVEIEHAESGRRTTVSHTQARAFVARGWRIVGGAAPAEPADAVADPEPVLETYERVASRFDDSPESDES